MIIQKYLSRFENPRFKLSQEAFINSDLSVFFSEKIPFADRTGEVFAQKLVELLISRVQKLPNQDKIIIYELGSGHGLLAKRILDVLEKRFNPLYQRTILYITDSSPSLIKALKKSKIFAIHSNHTQIQVMDVANPKFSKSPNFVYFTNSIDSLPCRHLIIRNGQSWEIMIQTNIKPGFDPNHLSPAAIEEKYQAYPIDQSSSMTTEEKEDLKELVSSLPADSNISVFNYNFVARKLIKTILDSLDEKGFVFFSDFGTTKREDISFVSPWLEHGLTIAFTVDFFGISHFVRKIGKKYWLTSNAPGHPQEMLIDNTKFDKNLGISFLKLF